MFSLFSLHALLLLKIQVLNHNVLVVQYFCQGGTTRTCEKPNQHGRIKRWALAPRLPFSSEILYCFHRISCQKNEKYLE